ncbi:MAG: hypothetical protein JWM87_2999 [Candidatus Eremiobacteraeota bacterium]|nr:hypothetical protein [Candidatus Eremiobacteraeota bacterium]
MRVGRVRHTTVAGTLPSRFLRCGRYRCVRSRHPGSTNSASTRHSSVPHPPRHDGALVTWHDGDFSYQPTTRSSHSNIVPGRGSDIALAGRRGSAEPRMGGSAGAPSDRSARSAQGASPPQQCRSPGQPPPVGQTERAVPPSSSSRTRSSSDRSSCGAIDPNTRGPAAPVTRGNPAARPRSVV